MEASTEPAVRQPAAQAGGTRSGPHPFAHLDAQLALLYRRVMGVFTAAKQRFVVHLRPEDVTEALRADPLGEPVTADQVAEALRSLEGWGNLRADPDTSRVTTVEDFYRARYLYQLSREGEAAERALALYEAELGRRGELQAVALEDIRVRLRALAALPADPDPAVVHNLLLELIGRLDSLAANASAFMGSLQRTIDLTEIDEEAFLAYKDRLIGYLERFVSELVVKAYNIESVLRQLAAGGPGRVEQLLRLAAQREAADVAPGDAPSDAPADGRDAAGAERRAATERKLEQWRARWSGLASWFVTADRQHPSQAELLLNRTRQAIPDLLATISMLQERRTGRSDRSADFRALARWFAETVSDADAHRLWRAAFGLSPARHLTAEPTAEPPEVPAGTSWLNAPRTEIAPRLRATGRYQRRGQQKRVRDRSAEREHLARQVAAEREQAELARARLVTGRPARLSELGKLDSAEFALFLRLLGDALAAGPPGADGAIRTRTTDGTMEIVLRPLPGAGIAEIVTPGGVMRGPDHELTITDCTGMAGSPVAAARPAGSPFAAARPAGSPFAAARPAGSPVAAARPAGSPVAAARPAGSPVAAARPAGSPVAAARPAGSPFAAARPAGSPVAAARPAGSPVAAARPAGSPVAAARPAGSPFAAARPANGPVATARPAGDPVPADLDPVSAGLGAVSPAAGAGQEVA
jgi:uncharacterized protein (TIGR02677 family)